MKFYLLIILVCLTPFLAFGETPIPSSSQKVILVITDSVEATTGSLYFFERESSKIQWKPSNKVIPISLGRSGLGNGLGLHKFDELSDLPPKQEGDGRSPAGVYKLSSVFGHKTIDQMNNLKMPYIHITEMTECIDDASSEYYNQIVLRNEVQQESEVDWNSSEKMSRAKICYDQGIVVEHNTNPITKSSGSCIFIHNWSKPFETTAGCTVMTPENMKELIYWLDKSKEPVLVQLTKKLYLDLSKSWHLPNLNF